MKLDGVAFVAGLAGFFLGGIGVYLASDARHTAEATAADFENTARHDDEISGQTFERLTALEETDRSHNEQIRGANAGEEQLREKVRELIARIEALEKARPATGVAGDDGPSGDLDARAQDLAQLRELRAKLHAGTADESEQAEFWRLARTTGALDDEIADLKRAVDAAPRDVDARMRLASGYLTKLLTVPDGPERGAWAGRAEEQWQAVLELEPENWQARFNVAFSWSQYPPFVGKAPAAIREFEKLRELQERGAARPEQAQVYLQLAELYRGQGNAAKAEAALRAGVARHPDATTLREALDAASER